MIIDMRYKAVVGRVVDLYSLTHSSQWISLWGVDVTVSNFRFLMIKRVLEQRPTSSCLILPEHPATMLVSKHRICLLTVVERCWTVKRYTVALLDKSSELYRARHLPCGITQCYLPSDTSEHARLTPATQVGVRDLPTPEGWKAELT